ncbi:MAG: hypothetical protein ACRDTE_16310 [Pseudonocardiaceae bacterium]
MTWELWWVWAGATGDRRRYPDKGLRPLWRRGPAEIDPYLVGALVSRLCPRCAGSAWSPRRL